MELRPADLGGSRAVRLIRQRASAYQSNRMRGRMRSAFAAMQRPQGKPTLGALGRFITHGSGMDDATAAEAMAATQSMTSGMFGGLLGSSVGMLIPMVVFASGGNYVGAATMGMMWTMMGGIFLGIPLTLTRKWIHTPLSDFEINDLGEGNTTSLERAFGQLIREVARQNISPEAEEGLRDAIRSIGDAIDRLPPVPSSTDIDAARLRENAQSVRVKAAAETDTVTQASLSRQADALERSALSAERSAVLLRRTNALYDELAAQIEALRLGLTAFYTGNADISGLASLSENVRSVAVEASSVAAARTELDTISPLYPSTTTEPALLKLR